MALFRRTRPRHRLPTVDDERLAQRRAELIDELGRLRAPSAPSRPLPSVEVEDTLEEIDRLRPPA